MGGGGGCVIHKCDITDNATTVFSVYAGMPVLLSVDFSLFCTEICGIKKKKVPLPPPSPPKKSNLEGLLTLIWLNSFVTVLM